MSKSERRGSFNAYKTAQTFNSAVKIDKPNSSRLGTHVLVVPKDQGRAMSVTDYGAPFSGGGSLPLGGSPDKSSKGFSNMPTAFSNFGPSELYKTATSFGFKIAGD